MEFLIREYILKLKEKDIYNYALKEGIKLENEEVKTIYIYIKNYWQTFLKDKETSKEILEELKDKLNKNTYLKICELYNKFKK